MAEYTLSRQAGRDLENITAYTFETYGLQQAKIYTTQIHDSAKIAAVFPEISHVYKTRSAKVYRQYNCGRHALFYRPLDSGILIVRILHLAMDFDQHLK